MTQGAKPGPPSGKDDGWRESRADQAAASRDGQDAGALVWPPPEDELDSLEVIPLGAPSGPARVSRPELAAAEGATPTPGERSGAPGVPRREPEMAAPADSAPVAGRRTATGVAARPGTSGARVPLWATILLMLASGGAGFAAAWFLR